jgi:hypothetical protein
MNMLKRISIPEPCHQPWQEMATVSGGRHCDSCCKTVVDFTEMSTGEVIKYLATAKNVCGRFTDNQLPGLNQSVKLSNSPRKIWKYFGIAAVIAGIFSTIKVEAQVRKSPNNRHTKHLNVQSDTSRSHSGTDSLYGKPLTADEINIDKGVKLMEVKDFAVNVPHDFVGYLVGGIQVMNIVVDDNDWRNSSLPLRVLFKY